MVGQPKIIEIESKRKVAARLLSGRENEQKESCERSGSFCDGRPPRNNSKSFKIIILSVFFASTLFEYLNRKMA